MAAWLTAEELARAEIARSPHVRNNSTISSCQLPFDLISSPTNVSF